MTTVDCERHYFCQRCESLLESPPEYECGEWFLRCRACGAKNFVVLTLSIVGWRLPHLTAASSASLVIPVSTGKK